MKFNLVGIRDTRFMNDKTGEVISGKTIFVTYEEYGVRGLKADKLFLSEKKNLYVPSQLPAEIDIQFNRYGKIDSIDLA